MSFDKFRDQTIWRSFGTMYFSCIIVTLIVNKIFKLFRNSHKKHLCQEYPGHADENPGRAKHKPPTQHSSALLGDGMRPWSQTTANQSASISLRGKVTKLCPKYILYSQVFVCPIIHVSHCSGSLILFATSKKIQSNILCNTLKWLCHRIIQSTDIVQKRAVFLAQLRV